MAEGPSPANPHFSERALRELAGMYVWSLGTQGQLTVDGAYRRGFDLTWIEQPLPDTPAERRAFFSENAPPPQRVFANIESLSPQDISMIQGGSDPSLLKEESFLPPVYGGTTPGRTGWQEPEEPPSEQLFGDPWPGRGSMGMPAGTLVPVIGKPLARGLGHQIEHRQRQRRELSEDALARIRASPGYRRAYANAMAQYRNLPPEDLQAQVPRQMETAGAVEESQKRVTEGWYGRPRRDVREELRISEPAAGTGRLRRSPFGSKEEAMSFSEDLGRQEAEDFLRTQMDESSYRVGRLEGLAAEGGKETQARAQRRMQEILSPEEGE